jgi:tetratricopeptide (TPR) repeat protein
LTLTGTGDHDGALLVLREGQALAAKLGSNFFVNRFFNSLGWLHAECGDLGRALELNQEGVGASRERGDPETIANAQLNLGDAYLVRNEHQVAREYFEAVYRLARKRSTSDWMKWRYSQHLFAGLGETWLALDDCAKADSFCHQCLELATRTDSRKYLVRGWRLKGEIAKARLQWEEAEECFRKALGFAERVGNPTQLWKTHLALGQLYRDTRSIDAAHPAFAAARKVIDGIGQSLRTPELQDGFERSLIFETVYEQIEAA